MPARSKHGQVLWIISENPGTQSYVTPLVYVKLPTCRLFQQATSEKKEEQVHEFKAETKNLLDIVARSLYSEPDIFVRELISNAADAIEKLRFLQATKNAISDPDLSPEIRIEVNEKENSFTIQVRLCVVTD